LLQTASIRLGFAPGEVGDDDPAAALANAGVIASSNGSPSAMPAPRRNPRRERTRLFGT
jgi:hypothetical protein